MTNSKERITQNPERKQDTEALHEIGAELGERLNETRQERAGESNKENLKEIRHEVEALNNERLKEKHESTEQAPASAERQRSGITRKESFNAIMSDVQEQLSPVSRTFSKVIHNKTVERVSEATGNTVARPDAILSGAVFAFLATLGVYLVAKNLGYPLSGFETIGAFALGWIFWLVFDFLKVMVTGRK